MTASAAILYAVIVGSNVPTGPDVRPLRYADVDAVGYAQLLEQAGAQVTLLTALDEDTRALYPKVQPQGAPTRAALYQTLEKIQRAVADDKRAGRPSEVMLVYGGHGGVDHGEGYVQLADGRLQRSELYKRLLPMVASADRVHVLVDACKSYFLVFERGAAGTRQKYSGHFVDAVGPQLFPNVGFVLSTSSGADSHEWEEYQGGVFSHEVRSALRGAADADRNGAISYAELGAFVRRANQLVPNARYRPEFTVSPPQADLEKLRATLLRWPDDATARRLTVDVPVGRFLVEDEVGARLLDAHPAQTGVVLHVPESPVYLRTIDSPKEYAFAAGSGDATLSSTAPQPVRIARRGALQAAFLALFEAPFSEADVDAFVAAPTKPLEPPIPVAERVLPVVRWSSLGVGLATGLSGLACTLAAVETPTGTTNLDVVTARNRITALNTASVTLYAVAGASLLTTVITTVWPKLAHRRARLVGGPAAAGAGVSIALP